MDNATKQRQMIMRYLVVRRYKLPKWVKYPANVDAWCDKMLAKEKILKRIDEDYNLWLNSR
jgi:pyrroloquinoline quinone (PQQ) biosynthesis protein C